MVESCAKSVEDKLVDGLSFKLDLGASYIHERKSVTFHPQGSNIYKPGARTKLIKIALTGQDWLDPTTFRAMFDVVNNEYDQIKFKQVYPVSGPWGFFRRVRLLASGQLLEDIDYYSRVHEMMEILSASDSRNNEAVEGFGYLVNEHDQISVRSIIGVSDRLTVCFKPLCGLLNQSKFIPLSYVQSLSFELEIVDNASEPIVNAGDAQLIIGDGTVINPYFTLMTSMNWQIEQVQVKCDMVSLDTGLQNSYTELLMNVKEIPIHFNTLISQYQTIRNQSQPFVNVSRAATRLKSIFVSFNKDQPKGTTEDPYSWRSSATRKSWNEFYSPGSTNNIAYFTPQSSDEFEFQIQIGSKLFPEYPIRSHAEAYYQLRKTLGVQSSKVHSFDISPQEYRDNLLIIGIDTEKSLGASFTGLNTRSGDLMTVRMKYNNALSNTLYADNIHIVLHTDNIIKIGMTGVSVYG